VSRYVPTDGEPVTTCFCHRPGHEPGTTGCVFVTYTYCGCSGLPSRHEYGVEGCKTRQAGHREGDQPVPTPSGRPIVHELVIEDVRQRLAYGTARYGTGLQPFNGRSALRDAYEELLDLAAYLRQRIWEEENPKEAPIAPEECG